MIKEVGKNNNKQYLGKYTHSKLTNYLWSLSLNQFLYQVEFSYKYYLIDNTTNGFTFTGKKPILTENEMCSFKTVNIGEATEVTNRVTGI